MITYRVRQYIYLVIMITAFLVMGNDKCDDTEGSITEHCRAFAVEVNNQLSDAERKEAERLLDEMEKDEEDQMELDDGVRKYLEEHWPDSLLVVGGEIVTDTLNPDQVHPPTNDNACRPALWHCANNEDCCSKSCIFVVTLGHICQ